MKLIYSEQVIPIICNAVCGNNVCEYPNCEETEAIMNLPEVKAIPIDFINELIREPENAGSKSCVLSWLKKKWEEENDRN